MKAKNVHSYSKRIYKPRHNPTIWILLIFLLVASSIFFYVISRNTTDLDLTLKNDDLIPEQDQPYKNLQETSSPGTSEIADTKISKRIVETPLIPQKSNPPAFKQTPKSGQIGADDPLYSGLNRAREFYNNQEYQESLNLLVPLTGQHPDAMLYAGICSYLLENYHQAVSFLKKRLNMGGHVYLALRYLALSCYKIDDINNSYSYAKKALEIQNDGQLQSLLQKLIKEKDLMKDYADANKVKFRFQFSKFDHNEIKETVESILMDAYRDVTNSLNFFPQKPVTVILYNEKDFFDITRAPGWAGGLYDGKIRIPVKGIQNNQDLLKRVLYHEFTHSLVHALTNDCPLWINEGLAEYFSFKGGKKIGQIIPFQRLNAAFHAANPKIVAVAYLQSYSAVSYLVERFGLYRLKELLVNMDKGRDLNAAFRSIYYMSFDKFAGSWGKD